MPNPTTIKRVTDIAKDLANGKERAEILRKYAKKWQIAERSIDRYIERAKNEAEKLRNLANEVANNTLIEETKNAVKLGIKTKNERLLNLEKQIKDLQTKLDADIDVGYFVIGGKVQTVNKRISVTDRAYLIKTIKELESEISKLQGDYPNAKLEVTGKDGQPIKTETAITKHEVIFKKFGE